MFLSYKMFISFSCLKNYRKENHNKSLWVILNDLFLTSQNK